MALSFRTSTQNSSSTGTAISVAAPTGTTTGDLVKVIVHGNGQTTIVDNNHTVSGSNLTSGSSTTDGTSFSTASITPAANALILLTFLSRRGDSVEPAVPSSVTGNGLTWVQVNSIYYDTTSTSRRTLTVFRAMGDSPSTGAISITVPATLTSAVWSVDQFTGVDTSGTNGSGAVVQSATNLTASGTSLTATLSSFGSTNNATFGAFGNSDGLFSSTAGSGFAKLGDAADAETSSRCTTEWLVSNDTTVDMAFSSATELGGIAVEIKANSGFTEQINDYKPNTTNGHTMSIFSRVIQAGDPTTYNFTLGASGRWAAVAICATDTSTPQDDVAPSTTNAGNRDSAGDGNATTASITTGVDNAAHIVVAGWDTSAIGTITTPAGYTLLANANGGGNPIHTSYKVITPAGATGTTTPTNTEFAAYITFSFSIKGVAVATTTFPGYIHGGAGWF